MIQKTMIYANAAIRMYGNSLVGVFAMEDELGSPGLDNYSMATNIRENLELDRSIERRNRRVAIIAKESKTFDEYRKRLSNEVLPNPETDLKSVGKLKSLSELAATFTIPVGAILGVGALAGFLSK